MSPSAPPRARCYRQRPPLAEAARRIARSMQAHPDRTLADYGVSAEDALGQMVLGLLTARAHSTLPRDV